METLFIKLITLVTHLSDPFVCVVVLALINTVAICLIVRQFTNLLMNKKIEANK
jgi:hypothetical protein